MSGTGFSLSKWYLDCVTEEGDAVIVYAARLRWGVMRLSYNAVLMSERGEVEERATFRGCELPQVAEDGRLEWGSGRVGAHGEWARVDPAFGTVLMNGDSGSVVWRCEMPRARARVMMRGGRELRGLGYAERLEMTVRPWRLPIEELRWGRVLTERDGVAWIEWRGREPRLVVVHNGRGVMGRRVSERGVEWEGGNLELNEGAAMRSGLLGETALRPPLKWIVPRKMREVEETKWVARGKVRVDGGDASEGWAVHEVVRFGPGNGGTLG